MPLAGDGRILRCANGHSFPVVDDVPVLLGNDVPPTIGLTRVSLTHAWADVEKKNVDRLFVETLGISDEQKKGVRDVASRGSEFDPVVSYLVAATNGILYKHLVGSLTEYPIPDIRLPQGQGKVLLDIGCGWGRWSIAAAKKGYLPIGLDPSLGAVLAAKRLAKSLALPFFGVVADARFLPFRPSSFDAAFSYSVLQHFSKEDACLAFKNVRRALRPGGTFMVQMASALGVRSLQHQLRRGFREPTDFEVRYWMPTELLRTFRAIFGPIEMEADCYFGLGLQPADLQLMTGVKKLLIHSSEALRRASIAFKPLLYLADSLYLKSSNLPGSRWQQ